MLEVLKSKIGDNPYNAEQSPRIIKEICSEIQEKLKAIGQPQYKLITQVILMEARGQSSRVASRCLWDVENDNFAEVTYKNVGVPPLPPLSRYYPRQNY